MQITMVTEDNQFDFRESLSIKLEKMQEVKLEIIDIKYASTVFWDDDESVSVEEFSALIIYKEKVIPAEYGNAASMHTRISTETKDEEFSKLYTCLDKLDQDCLFRRPEIDYIRRFVIEHDSNLVKNILDKETK